MKLSFLSFIIFYMCANGLIRAQNTLEGKIVYTVSYSDKYFDLMSDRVGKKINKQKSIDILKKPQNALGSDFLHQNQINKKAMEAIIDSMPAEKEQLIYFKEDKIFYHYNTYFSQVFKDTLYSIFLKKDDSVFKIVLFNTENRGRIVGKKDITNENIQNNIVKIDYVQNAEIRDVLGYKCKKAIVTKEIRNTAQKMTVYYTEEIPNVHLEFKGLEGMVLLIENEEEGYVCTATQISFEPIPNEKFEIPKEYKILPKD